MAELEDRAEHLKARPFVFLYVADVAAPGLNLDTATEYDLL